MQSRDYITGRKKTAAIERLNQKEESLPRSEFAFSGGSLKSSETIGKDLIYVGDMEVVDYFTGSSHRVTLGLALPLSPAITIAHEDLVSRDDI
jgi:hypothetical protein